MFGMRSEEYFSFELITAELEILEHSQAFAELLLG